MEQKPTGITRVDDILYVLIPGFRAQDFEDVSYELEGDCLHVFLDRPDGITEQVSVTIEDSDVRSALEEGFEGVAVTSPDNIVSG